MSGQRRLVLASGSAARRQMLNHAGLVFDVRPADLDEEAHKNRLLERVPPLSHVAVALALAEEKALQVAGRNPGALVIGSDQILSTGATILSKPGSREGARQTLRRLRGGAHWLHSAVVVAEGETVLWRTVETATLVMWAFSDAVLEDYLAAAGDSIFGCVGAYQIEGPGVRLFESVAGDHFTIMGLPLLPLLHELRRMGEIEP